MEDLELHEGHLCSFPITLGRRTGMCALGGGARKYLGCRKSFKHFLGGNPFKETSLGLRSAKL